MKKYLLIAMCIYALNVTAQIPTNGLIGYYPFNGNANDVSGTGNNGIVNGSTLTTDRFGNANAAYSFDGVNNYINIAPVTLQSFSFSCWIYNTTVNPANLNGIISNLNGSFYTGFEWRVEPDSTLMLVCGVGNNWLQPKTTFKLLNNTWYHVVATNDNSTIKLYVNSQQIATYGIANFTNNSTNINFGTRDPSVSYGGFYTGKMDDIGIWNRALTQQEVQQIYNSNGTTSIPTLNQWGLMIFGGLLLVVAGVNFKR